MSDDLTKRGSESGGADSSPEYNRKQYQHLDRDQWYGDDDAESEETDVERPVAADPAPVVAKDNVDEAIVGELDKGDSTLVGEPAAEYPAQDDVTDSAEPENETSEPDPYDFGDVPAEGVEQPGDAVEDVPVADVQDEEPVEEPAPAAASNPELPAGLTTIGAGWTGKIGSIFGRFVNPVEDALKPARGLVETTAQRVIIGLAFIVALISLLADNSAFALMVLGFVLPLVIVLSVVRRDVFETEPPLILMGVGAVGLIVGLVLGGLGAWVVREQWIDSGTLNFGAAGYGGFYADREGNANFLIWLVNGLLLPLVALAAIIAVPIALRRYVQFRNEIMDGTILGAISAAGFAIGTTIVFLAPGVSDGLPAASVSDWTLTTFAVIATRPLILTLGGAMLGVAIWRYMRDADLYGMILPAAGSAGAWLLLSLGTVQLQPAGISIEFLWNILIAIAVFVVYRRVVAAAITIDRAALGANGGRIVCPHCRKITPAGVFCANCGESLS